MLAHHPFHHPLLFPLSQQELLAHHYLTFSNHILSTLGPPPQGCLCSQLHEKAAGEDIDAAWC